MNKAALLLLGLLGVGLVLWVQRDELGFQDSGAVKSATTAGIPTGHQEQLILREKVKPGGSIGRHSEAASGEQTRRASHYYFICTDPNSGAERIFLVPEGDFNRERPGNVLSAADISEFQEVSGVEEPPLPPRFQFRRHDLN